MDKTKKTILVIDDDVLNLKLMRGVFGHGKYNIIEADNAELGIRMAKEHHPDLILMDIQLPGMDGIQATKRIRADAEISSLQVIALSSYAMAEDMEAAMTAGCNGYISKPIDTRNFMMSVKKCLA